MTPLQAETLSATLAMYASIVVVDVLQTPIDDPRAFQQAVSKKCTTLFRQHIRSLHLIDDPDPKPKPDSAGEADA